MRMDNIEIYSQQLRTLLDDYCARRIDATEYRRARGRILEDIETEFGDTKGDDRGDAVEIDN